MTTTFSRQATAALHNRADANRRKEAVDAGQQAVAVTTSRRKACWHAVAVTISRRKACEAMDQAIIALEAAITDFQTLSATAEKHFDILRYAVPSRTDGLREQRDAHATLALLCLTADGNAIVIPLLQALHKALAPLNLHGLVEFRVAPVPESSVAAANAAAVNELTHRLDELSRVVEAG